MRKSDQKFCMDWTCSSDGRGGAYGLSGGKAKEGEQTAQTAAVSEEKTAGQTEGAESSGSELKGDIEVVTNADEATFNAVNGILQKFMEENPG